ncbi:lytic transglycosylase domain-containing protein [Polynucleobacter sp. MWH-UH25E]|uniref:lytic transglycosylase domain-containing protein n=1 Tax=Polynucleobacter sp. MWH-UH25E TaxID=1855616 RepID=UPI001BFD7232|nr:lytic transglycosylase domain-containing protein [Polynucleobacter sp. MWH-UH25E]QWD61784.1 lytic transglycosylase domain-containing protein [Polynucleobacter sp. MWH-UH25E]
MSRFIIYPIILLLFVGNIAFASPNYQEISLANRYELRQSLTSEPLPFSSFESATKAVEWISYQSRNLRNKIPNESLRREWLRMVHYESTRFNLDPDLVLALIEVESGFNRFAISGVGASGLMQVMPFWKDLIGDARDSLFDVRTNLRYGCIILKHYLEVEGQDVARGLARYNGSLGQDTYPNMVLAVWRSKYRFPGGSL